MGITRLTEYQVLNRVRVSRHPTPRATASSNGLPASPAALVCVPAPRARSAGVPRDLLARATLCCSCIFAPENITALRHYAASFAGRPRIQWLYHARPVLLVHRRREPFSRFPFMDERKWRGVSARSLRFLQRPRGAHCTVSDTDIPSFSSFPAPRT